MLGWEQTISGDGGRRYLRPRSRDGRDCFTRLAFSYLRRRAWFYDASELVQQHWPDILLIEPFLEDRDGILWIKELAKEFPDARILIVSRGAARRGRPGRCVITGERFNYVSIRFFLISIDLFS
jgi:hypothetical protein